MRHCYRFSIILLLISAAITVSGQESDGSRPRAPVSVPANSPAQQDPVSTSRERTSADESFDLNIDERRITRQHFEASTAVGTATDAHGLDLRIGVALAAERIDVLLRNVRGRVHFRGSLERVMDILNTRRGNSVPR